MPPGSQQGCIAESGSRLPQSMACGGFVGGKASRSHFTNRCARQYTMREVDEMRAFELEGEEG